jgi:4-hydroxy-3-polyprenylbenzoate decarboxylase
VDFVAGRVLDAAGVPHKLYRCWQGELGRAAHEAGAAGETGAAEPGRADAQGTDPFMP